MEADLLLHVMDGSSEQMLQQRDAVLAVLRRLGVSEMRLQKSLIEVVNKSDIFPGTASQSPDDTDLSAPDVAEPDLAAPDLAEPDLEASKLDTPSSSCGAPEEAGEVEGPWLHGGEVPSAKGSADTQALSDGSVEKQDSGADASCSGQQEAGSLSKKTSSGETADRELGMQREKSRGGFSGRGVEKEGTCRETDGHSAALDWARGRAGRQPSVVVTSAVTGDGLDDLLLEMDKKVCGSLTVIWIVSMHYTFTARQPFLPSRNSLRSDRIYLGM